MLLVYNLLFRSGRHGRDSMAVGFTTRTRVTRLILTSG